MSINPNEIRDTAEALIEDRGGFAALAWADHCMIRDTSGFWRAVHDEIDRQCAEAILAKASEARRERNACMLAAIQNSKRSP